MHRLPLADQLPYQFHPPRLQPWLVRASRFYRNRMLQREHRVERIEVSGVEHLLPLFERGDGVLLTPNHSDRADGLVLLDLADRVRRPFCAMAAYQIFTGDAGLRHWLFPRLGIFPVDREGADLAAIKAGVDILVRGRNPLVVFPEGEVYHLADRLTPLREGVGYLAATAAKRLSDTQRTVWIVPVGLKYRFPEGHDPLPALHTLMDELEARFTWWHHRDQPLVERVYRYAEAMLALKELEYLKAAQPGPLKERILRLRSHILEGLEARHAVKRKADSVPERVKELRRLCLDALADPHVAPALAHQLRKDLNDLFVVIQIFSYPGDYIRECPTLERVAEILIKCEEDVLGALVGLPRGPRHAVLRLGAPIDVREHLVAADGKPRLAAVSLTAALEPRIQSLLDEIGPGRRISDGQIAGSEPYRA